MELVGVGTTLVVVPTKPGMRAVDLVGKMLPTGIEAVGIKAVLPAPVDVMPSKESTPDTIPPRKSPEELGVAEAETEVVAEAGTLTGIVGSMLELDAVAIVLFPEEELSPSSIPMRSVPELVVELSLGLLALGVAETRPLVEPPRPRSSPMEARPEPTAPRTPPLEEAEDEGEATVEGVIDAWADELVAAAGVTEAELVVELPRPRSSPMEARLEPTAPRMPPLEEAAVEEAAAAAAAEVGVIEA
jgi:hypothetical protein